MQRVERFIEIDAPVERVFDLFSDFESFPRWMRNIKEVRRTRRGTTRWTADSAVGTDVEWEAETTVFEPDHRIAWRSVGGDLDTDGEVVLEETRRGTTLMHIVLGYSTPGGRSGVAQLARFFGKHPERQLEEDVERFKRTVERRERVYDERGEPRRVHARESRGQRERRRPDDREYYSDRARSDGGRRAEVRDRWEWDEFERDDYDRGGYRARGDRYDEETERERRFNEALREARRSQVEGLRRYREERERDEERRARRRHERDDWQREEVRADERARRYDRYRDESLEEEEREYRPRHAMTPRERELERAERRERAEREAAERFSRRGVDRLLDEGPSSRWRRWD